MILVFGEDNPSQNIPVWSNIHCNPDNLDSSAGPLQHFSACGSSCFGGSLRGGDLPLHTCYLVTLGATNGTEQDHSFCFLRFVFSSPGMIRQASSGLAEMLRGYLSAFNSGNDKIIN